MNKKFDQLLQRIPFYKLNFLSGFSKKVYFSSHKPHQGEQEKARRRKQIEKGMLKVDRGKT